MNFNYRFQSRSQRINCFVDQLLVETGPAGTHFVFEILQTHDQNSVHIFLQSTPDSIIDGIYDLLLAIEFSRRFILVRLALRCGPWGEPRLGLLANERAE